MAYFTIPRRGLGSSPSTAPGSENAPSIWKAFPGSGSLLPDTAPTVQGRQQAPQQTPQAPIDTVKGAAKLRAPGSGGGDLTAGQNQDSGGVDWDNITNLVKTIATSGKQIIDSRNQRNQPPPPAQIQPSKMTTIAEIVVGGVALIGFFLLIKKLAGK